MGWSENRPTYRCTYDSSCIFQTVHKSSVNRHIKRFHERIPLPKKFNCPQEDCDYQSADSHNIKTHFNRKHNDKQKPGFPCPICAKILSTKYVLEAHVSRHTGECIYHYCDKCEFKTAHIAALNNHRNVKHLRLKMVARPKKFQCDKCNLSFPSKANLANHMVVHNDERPFICNFPGCEFRSKYIISLKQHKERHSSKRKFPCPMCHKRFPTKYEMDRHILRIHTKEKSVHCDQCDYTTSLRSNLRNHQVEKHRRNDQKYSGTPEKPTAVGPEKVSEDDVNSRGNNDRDTKRDGHYYYCEYRGCSFRAKERKYIIGRHSRRVHAKQRLHSCSICSKRFFDNMTVINHMRTHTGERPFKCPFCDYAAARDCNVLRHVRVCHQDKVQTFKSIGKSTKTGKQALAPVLLSSVSPAVLLERTFFQFV